MTSRSSAFIRPGFLLALAMLIVNDHFLKPSAIHGWITGKLSDFSGLIIAPVVLSEVLRLLLGSSKKHTHFIHVTSLTSVGLAFAALKLCAPVAAAYDQCVTWVLNAACHTAVDPTDMIALASLPFAYGLMQEDERAELGSRTSSSLRGAGQGSFFVALFACIATSPAPSAPGSRGRVFLQNATDATVDVRVRWYRGIFDCVRAQRDFDTFSASMQDRALFGQGVTFRLRAAEFAPLDQEHAWAQTQTPRPSSTIRQTTCEVALVSTDGAPEVLVLVDTTLPETFVGASTTALDSSLTIASLRNDPSPRIDPRAVPVARFMPSTRTSCPAEAPLLTFSDPALVGTNSVVLAAKERNDDGCFDLELTRGVASTPFFVCVPEAFFPFAVGETLSFRSNTSSLEITGASDELTVGIVRNVTQRDVSLGLLRFQMTEPARACGTQSACGAFDVPSAVSLTYDGVALPLDSNRSAMFATNQRIAVGAALTRIAAPDECGLTLGAQFTYARLRRLP